MKTKFSLFIIFLFSLLTTNCNLVNEVRKDLKRPVTYISRDNRTQMTVPGTWVDSDDEDKDVTLKINHMIDDVLIFVISTPKDDVSDRTLDEYTEFFIQETEKYFQNPKTTKTQSQVINRLTARQVFITGYYNEDKEDVGQIYTFVESEEFIHIITTNSNIEKFEEYKPELLKIIKSFRELPS